MKYSEDKEKSPVFEWIKCPVCHGKGYRESRFSGVHPVCHICKGKGFVRNNG